MYFSFLLAIIAGIFSGIITGLAPGIHVNLVTLLVVSWSNFHPLITAVYIFSLGITHTFLDAIPAVFLGAPDEDMALLPGHELFIKGGGHEAVKLTVVGSFFTMLLGVIFMPLLFFSLPKIYSLLKPVIVYLLAAIIIFLLFKSKKFYSLITFLLSGFLGLIVLNSNLENNLFPLLTGLFAMSSLISSVLFPPKIVKQQITNIVRLEFKELITTIFGSGIAGTITSIFPGLSPAQSTALVQPIFSRNKFSYLVFVGGVNTIDFFISLTTLYLISKARNGALIGIKQTMLFISIEQVIALACVGILAGSIASILTLKISQLMVNLTNKIDLKKVSISILIFLTTMVFFFTGWAGLMILLASSFIGLIPILSRTPRSFSMGVLLLPVIISLG